MGHNIFNYTIATYDSLTTILSYKEPIRCLCSFQVQRLALATIVITLFFMIKYSPATNFLSLVVHTTKT